MGYLLGIVFLELIVFFVAKRSSIILSKKDLYPDISKELIDKYKAYSAHLGWTNISNSVKHEISKGNSIEYTYTEFGARSAQDQSNLPPLVSTWGDSYCQCREVGDTGTWQYYLSKSLGKGVSNYGVGNYGADQAILRLKAQYDLNPTKCVILAFTPYTITRITSVWKHFSEFGNILAFKPRFVVENEILRLVPNIIEEKEMLEDRSNYLKHVERYDDHRDYIDKHVYNFPYTLSALLKPRPLLRTLFEKIANVLSRLNIMKLAERFSDLYYRSEIEYRKQLNQKNEALMRHIIEEFTSFSKVKNFKPILLFLPAIEDVRYFKGSKDAYYSNCKATQALDVYDFMDVLSQEQNLSDCFVDSLWGGHYSSYGNKKLAEFLEKKLNEIDIEI